MTEKKTLGLNQTQLSLVLFFVLCRLTILLFYDAYVSDVSFYQDIAKQGLLTHAKAYENFAFGYPPLSLFFVYLPGWFSNLDFWDYWRNFRAQMFIVDLTLFAACFYYLKRNLELEDEKIVHFVVFYTLFGFLQGHLIYDRLDLFIVASLLGLFLAFNSPRRTQATIIIISTLGMLIKFVPFLYAIVLNLICDFMKKSAPPKALKDGLVLIKNGLRELCLLLLPFFTILLLYQVIHAKGVLADLKMHFQRGIQVESTWATPIAIKHLIKPQASLVVNNYGAQHIDETQVPEWYLSLSKISGILVLAAFGLYLFLKKGQKIFRVPWTAREASYFSALIWLVVFLLFLATQRVLSPQFFIWIMIPISVLLALEFDAKLAFLALATYVLTYVGFDIGY
jgi:hypothetical protein